MNIRFQTLVLTNFKSHKSLKVSFDDITSISGNNGLGKSTIAEAITFCLYGVDPMGSKMDPTPITYSSDETLAEILIEVDGKQVLLARGMEKGKAKYYINDVPEKATPFDELVNSLFDKNLFLSLFNPGYFFTQHWEKQRAQLLQYVSEPTDAEVLKEMADLDIDMLAPLLKKHSLDDVEKIHRENYNKKDKDYIRAQERVRTLEEQLAKMQPTDAKFDRKAAEQKLTKLNAQLAELETSKQEEQKISRQRASVTAKMEALKKQGNDQKAICQRIKDEPIQENCRTCGQSLNEDSVALVKQDKNNRLAAEVEKGKRIVSEFNELKLQLENLPNISYEVVGLESDLLREISDIKESLNAGARIADLQAQISEAKTNETEVLKSRNDSLVIVDSVKAFRAQQAVLMAKKVSGLFKTLSIRLFEQQKNGEFKNTFEIEMDSKPFSKLSTAEKIRAGLELIEVLSSQSEVIAPTFIDNAESIMKFTKPSGQLITARAIDEEFKIITKSLREEAVNV